MKKIIAIFILITIGGSNFLNAQSSHWLWAHGAATTGSIPSYGFSVSSDANGNAFMTGYFSGSITFGSTTLTNGGGTDVFLVKYDPIGNVMWAKSAIGSSYDYGYSVSTDATGNVFIAGSFDSPTLLFDTITLTKSGASGANDIFIAKYDPNGNVLWAKSEGGTLDDEAYSICTDVLGNVFMTGLFNSSSITFGTTTLNNAGGRDIYIVKYDPNGNAIWANSTGGTGDDEGNSISTDPLGNVLMTGGFTSSAITFGTTTLTNAGDWDLFVVKYDLGGNVLWAKSAGGPSYEIGYGVTSDLNGNVIMTGAFQSATISIGATTLTNVGNHDIIIAKYDANGNEIWAKGIGGTQNDEGISVACDASGNVFTSGFFYSSAINIGTFSLTNNHISYSDIVIVKYDPNGNIIWAERFGGGYSDFSHYITTDGLGNLFITGWSDGQNLTFGTITINTWGLFIAKFDGTTVGIKQLSEHSGISIAPNPFTTETTLTFKEEQNNTTIKITDVLGAEIKNATFSGKQYVIEKGTMHAGIYFIKSIDEKKNSVNRKIIIQ